MRTIKMPEEIDHNRRSFCGTTAIAVAAAHLGIFGSKEARAEELKAAGVTASKPGTNTSFGPLKQIDAGMLNVGYAEAGPANGRPAILLHGWPYDIHSYVDVAPLFASAGYRAIVPHLRGYGTTRFLSSETFRNGQQTERQSSPDVKNCHSWRRLCGRGSRAVSRPDRRKAERRRSYAREQR